MEVLSMAPSSATCRSAHRLTNTLPRRRLLTRRSRTTELCVAKAGDQQQINASRLLDPTQVASIPVSLDRALPIAIAAVAGISWYLLKQVRRGKQKQRVRSPGSAEFDAALEGANAQDGREYRMALARTRQAVAVHRAIGFAASNNTARAMVELRRALHENSVCRSPMLNTQHDAAQLQILYRLHLENTAQPADFATLLQLRTLLDLDFDVAEKIETEVMEQGSAYSI